MKNPTQQPNLSAPHVPVPRSWFENCPPNDFSRDVLWAMNRGAKISTPDDRTTVYVRLGGFLDIYRNGQHTAFIVDPGGAS